MSQAQEELDALLGVSKPVESQAATEALPVQAMDATAAALEALLQRVDAAPADKQIAALLGGAAALVDAARAEGPALVSHLADELKAHALTRLAPAVTAA